VHDKCVGGLYVLPRQKSHVALIPGRTVFTRGIAVAVGGSIAQGRITTRYHRLNKLS